MDDPSPLPTVEIVAFHLDSDRDIRLAEAEDLLDGTECARAASFRFDRHRERFTRGRGLVRRLLAQRLGRDPRALRFETGLRGKPRLAGEASTVHFNLSHSEDLGVVALAPFPDVGIDLERLDRRVDFAGLSRRCFRPPEIARVEARRGLRQAEAFFWTWTAKEARMKATGEGFGLPPQRIEVAFDGELPSRYLAPEEPASCLVPLRLHEAQAVCTVAALRPFALGADARA